MPTEPRPTLLQRVSRHGLSIALFVVTSAGLVAGVVGALTGHHHVADACWITATGVALVPATWSVIVGIRRGRLGVDIIAVLALVGTVLVGEYLAGALIGVMFASGQALETAASTRATKDLRELVDRAPRSARLRAGNDVRRVPLEEVVVGDLVAIGPGELIPLDGWVSTENAILDESALTGEPMHVERRHGEDVRSGVLNAGGPVEIVATATAADSTYAGIVRLAQEAGAENAQIVRLADRFALWFLPFVAAIVAAAWLASGSATRAVAVLVVATPCPLLLAAPVAIVSGLSRAARFGVVIRDGGALENLGRARTLLLDKTGTVTMGRPTGSEIVAGPGVTADEILRVAASADQFSAHVFAEAIVREARVRGLDLVVPVDVAEQQGTGVSATVDGHRVTVGVLAPLAEPPRWVVTLQNRLAFDGTAAAWVTIDGVISGAIVLNDPIRSDAPRTLRRLRAQGLRRVVLLTGDRPEPAREIGTILGIDDIYAEQSPSDKVARVRSETGTAITVMVGDGVNDAPALAAASVGIAMGARGSSASTEAADVVLTADRLDRVADAMVTAQRARRIATQSAVGGMVMSCIAMGFAAFGLLTPAVGALTQELIDVAVILNAMRALGGRPAVDIDPRTDAMLVRFSSEHDHMRDELSILRETAELITGGDRGAAHAALRRTDDFLRRTLLPHERAEDTDLYPALARPLGSSEATAPMSRMHVEIEHQCQRLHQHLVLADSAGALSADQTDDLLSCLYGLHALLRLHFIQEEECYFSLAVDPAGALTRNRDGHRANRTG
ncbi:heavy metal translocating P-type ATPase [Rhodococcus sp. UNC363MFTsu5.1]|uniref:heavy metal translocating P-type ATPase n=1 Tax=Rhodococcus sp. UNC363MFTsu5.1 TaxID=1449069 RepID=UPI00068EAFE4|nr:heavy metal translocating P-type ATPase [Rhodococcus sp. UNC363MFTsu5.1]